MVFLRDRSGLDIVVHKGEAGSYCELRKCRWWPCIVCNVLLPLTASEPRRVEK
jgi:hypothetical protein